MLVGAFDGAPGESDEEPAKRLGWKEQLYDALSVPSLNDFAKGKSHSSVLVGAFIQMSRSACVRQYARGSALA
jgi:hypothetical protein